MILEYVVYHYVVFHNDLPCTSQNYPFLKECENHIFSTLDQARDYVDKCMGPENEVLGLEVNVPFHYNDLGDVIEIRKVRT